MRPDRAAGILLHPTSLPGDLGIGDLGPDAWWFLERSVEMGLSWWQMLPLGPTGYGDSPYQSPSTFAGNPLLISITRLVDDGLLDRSAAEDRPDFPDGEVDYRKVIDWRMGLLGQATRSFIDQAGWADSYRGFCTKHGPVWLDDFAVFDAIKRSHRGLPWWEWDRGLALREPTALEHAAQELAGLIEQVKVEQFLFQRDLSDLRARCEQGGVGIIGDLPIFVAHDSADVWANRDLFLLDPDGLPTVVAGVPPDYFSETGQRWGNPLYDWERHRQQGFAWWTARMRRAFSLFDLVRIDHFRGFAASWHIPRDEPTAQVGEWVDAPGEELFDRLGSELGELPVIAEDLGVITPDVEELRDRYGFCGMRVLQFGFTEGSPHHPSRYHENVVAYTGTHDNDTTLGWWRSLEDPAEREAALELIGHHTEVNWGMIEAVMRSAAAIAVIPLQDLIGLGSEARMNVPGTESGNWGWRLRRDQLTPEVIATMRTLTEESGRVG